MDIGFSLLKTFTMSTGEFEFGDLLIDDNSTVRSDRLLMPTTTYVMFALFVNIMTIIIMNLLVMSVDYCFLCPLLAHSNKPNIRTHMRAIAHMDACTSSMACIYHTPNHTYSQTLTIMHANYAHLPAHKSVHTMMNISFI